MPPKRPAEEQELQAKTTKCYPDTAPFAPKSEILALLLSEDALEQPVSHQGEYLGWRNRPPTVKTEMGDESRWPHGGLSLNLPQIC